MDTQTWSHILASRGEFVSQSARGRRESSGSEQPLPCTAGADVANEACFAAGSKVAAPACRSISISQWQAEAPQVRHHSDLQSSHQCQKESDAGRQ